MRPAPLGSHLLDKLRTFLPLPMGEVAERSEDGEGKQGAAPGRSKRAARPSQSPSVTALPKGEPRRLRARTLRGYWRLRTLRGVFAHRNSAWLFRYARRGYLCPEWGTCVPNGVLVPRMGYYLTLSYRQMKVNNILSRRGICSHASGTGEKTGVRDLRAPGRKRRNIRRRRARRTSTGCEDIDRGRIGRRVEGVYRVRRHRPAQISRPGAKTSTGCGIPRQKATNNNIKTGEQTHVRL